MILWDNVNVIIKFVLSKNNNHGPERFLENDEFLVGLGIGMGMVGLG